MGMPKNYYLLLGQSNATEILKDAMQDELLKYDPAAKVIRINHGGNSIEKWFTDIPQDNYYIDDIYINKNIISISKVKAIFWFQGESNSNTIELTENFTEYTHNYFNKLLEDYGNININIFKIFRNMSDPGICERVEIIRSMQEEINTDYSGIIYDTKDYKRYPESSHLIDSEYDRLGHDVIKYYMNILNVF